MEYRSVFTKAEYEDRLKNLRATISDLDISFIFGRADMFYYSSIGQDGFLAISETPTRYIGRNLDLAKELTHMEVKSMPSFRVFKEISRDMQISSIGLELDILPYKTVDYISRAFDKPEITDISSNLREIRSVKSEAEIQLMKEACKQTDASFEMARDYIKPGISEAQISGEIHRFLRNEGHPGWVQVRKFDHNYTALAYVMAGESTGYLNSGFGPVSGKGSSRYHMNGPSTRKVQDGDAILIDTTGVVEGYTADETRTFFLGKVPEIYENAYEVCMEVQNLISKILVDGARAPDVYQEVIELISNHGLEENFMGIGDDRISFLGHGVGLELDEVPIITPGYKKPIQSGQVVAIEPKFIFNDPKGGVGIEDTWVVRDNKADKLTQYPWLNRI